MTARRKMQSSFPRQEESFEAIEFPKKRQKYLQEVKKDSVWLKSKFVPKSLGQEFYVTMLNECDITMCFGPAGTGKTWIATRFALEKLISHEVDRIVCTKPIMEAGSEEIGFLPGEVADKILPHFQSILDCFEDHIGPMAVKRLIETEKLQFLPTAYARGRGVKNSYFIIDEAQNLTKKGIKLLMTRIAEGSQMCINGDTDQTDLPNPKDSGFMWAIDCLRGKNAKIGVAELTFGDIQRHPLIETILINLR